MCFNCMRELDIDRPTQTQAVAKLAFVYKPGQTNCVLCHPNINAVQIKHTFMFWFMHIKKLQASHLRTRKVQIEGQTKTYMYL